jgi:putative endonuclease
MSSHQGTIYTGVTSDLDARVYEHKHGIKSGFASKYRANKLVYFEETSDVHAALAREKQIKGWLRSKKVALITAFNPRWDDLAPPG